MGPLDAQDLVVRTFQWRPTNMHRAAGRLGGNKLPGNQVSTGNFVEDVVQMLNTRQGPPKFLEDREQTRRVSHAEKRYCVATC